MLLRIPLAVGADEATIAIPIDPAALGRIGFVTGNMDPVYDFDAFFEGKGQGAAGGALKGAGGCLDLIQRNDSSGLSAVLALVCLPFGALGGAVMGAERTAPAAAVEETQALAQDAVGTLRLNEAVLQSGLDHAGAIGLSIQALDPTLGPTGPDDAPAYAGLIGTVESVIEVSVQGVDAKTSGLEGVPVSFEIEARVRIVNVPDGRVLDSYVIHRVSKARPADDWLASEAVALRTELPTLAQQFAVQALEEFMIYRPAIPATPSAGSKERVPGYAIRAIDPPIRVKMAGFHPFVSSPAADTVNNRLSRFNGRGDEEVEIYGIADRIDLEGRGSRGRDR